MPITINGSGTVTGISAGGLPDASIVADDLASNAVTTAKIADANITTAKVADANITAAKLDGAQSGSAPIYGARAWVNFNGTGVVAIRASGNVSSITDNNTGLYTVNFTTAMVDGNYTVSHTYSPEVNVQHTVGFLGPLNTSSLTVAHFSAAASQHPADKSVVCIAVFR